MKPVKALNRSLLFIKGRIAWVRDLLKACQNQIETLFNKIRRTENEMKKK